ncbi:MAG: hypothetical protein C0592_01365 [Marinilabiliales bacterium]|nr:MAG: hypothetical protein C0592_01365 [Marinilabiliales bacterium]
MNKVGLFFVFLVLASAFVSAQSVGVGSTAFTPQSTLHVYNAAGGNLFQLSNSTAASTGFQINMNSGVNFSVINRQNGYMSFYTNNTEYMRLTNTGYLGVGTATPQRKIDIRGDGVLYCSGQGFSEGFNVFHSAGSYWTGYNLHVGAAGTAPSAATMKGYFRVNAAGSRLLIGTFTGATDIEAISIPVATGYIGMGNTTPYYPLHIRQTGSTPITLLNIHVSGTTTDQAGIIRFTNTTNNNSTDQYSSYIAGIRTNSPSSGAQALAFGTSSSTAAPVERMRIDPNGNVGIGTTTPSYKLHVIGRLKTDGINETSDIRLKKNIEPLSGSISLIQQLQGVTYEWISPDMEQGLQMGLIAQDVEKVIPYLVNTDNEGYKSIQYSVLVALLIEGTKEQQEEIEELKTQISEMQKQIDELMLMMSFQADNNQ